MEGIMGKHKKKRTHQDKVSVSRPSATDDPPPTAEQFDPEQLALSSEDSHAVAPSAQNKVPLPHRWAFLKRWRGQLKLSTDLQDSSPKRWGNLHRVSREDFLGMWDILILLLSFYTLITLGIQVLFELSDSYHRLLSHLDFVVCLIFLTDFFVRLYLAPKRLNYLKWGWIDLISSIPHLESFRWGRTLRLIRILRALRSMRYLHKKLESRFQDSFIFVIISSFILTTVSALAVLYLEGSLQESNIKSAEDALWWAWVTITTVGYGDFYPVTTEGRILASVLMSAGVGIFGVFTVQFTRYLVNSSEKDVIEEVTEVRRSLAELHEELQSLRALIEARPDADQTARSTDSTQE
jgi:voltage-gated potassium channel